MKEIREVHNCRVCDSKNLYEFLDLGFLPIPNGFLTRLDLKKTEKKYPLVVLFCKDCSLVQLKYIVNPEVMFKNYLYIPSISQTRLNNFQTLAADALRYMKGITKQSLIVDIGSNDGSLLNVWKNRGHQILGVDPAENLVTIAELNGIRTELGYFTSALARKLKKKYGPAHVIFATNVFAHIDDIVDFLNGITHFLDDEGIFISQFPYLADLVQENQFDTIYHEHLSYFSVRSLLKLAERTNLEIFSIEHSDLDGGSLKVFWKRKMNKSLIIQTKKINSFLNREEREKLYRVATYDAFSERVRRLRTDVKKKLFSLKQKKNIIIGYGAAAKGNILLNYFHIGTNIIQYIVDSTPYKQGRFTPGTHVPIFAEQKMRETQPDYMIILAWNFKDEIMKKNRRYSSQKGKFIICIPSLTII